MATAIKLKSDIKKLKKAIETKGISDSIKSKLKVQLEKVENELAAMQKGAKPRKVSTTKGTATALTALQKLIKRKKYGVYQGKGVDLKKDAGEGAMASGRRESKGLKSNQFGDKKSNKGNVYYEYRPNRIDVKQPKMAQKYPKLEKGGIMAEGGSIPNNYEGKTPKEVWDSWNYDQKFHFLNDHKYDKSNPLEMSRFDLSDIADKSSYDELPKNIKLAISDHISEGQYAKGGYMAKGGKTKNWSGVKKAKIEDLKSEIEQLDKYLKKLESENTKEAYEASNNLRNYKATLQTKILNLEDEMASGGYMADGGETKIDQNRMYNFFEEDLQKLKEDIKEGNKEEVDKFFSYWNTHLKSLEPKSGSQRMYNFLKEDLVGLEDSVKELPHSEEEIDRFFSYWDRHLSSLKMAKGGYMASGGMMDNEPKYDGAGFTREDDMRIILKSGNNGNLKEVFNAFKNQRNELAANEIFDEEKAKGKSVFMFVGDELYDQYIQDEDEDEYEKGGSISKSSTYVSNRNINELSVVLKGNIKTLKGSDILDGVYVKNSALSKLKSKKASAPKAAASSISVDDAHSKLVAKAKELNLDQDDIDAIKKSDVKKLISVGYNLEDLYLIYLGALSLSNTQIDNEISPISGLLSYSKDYIPTKIEKIVKAAKEKKFELGLKYPDFNWSDIVKKYSISKDGKEIDGAEMDFGTTKEYYVYTIFEGKNVVLGTSTDRVITDANGKVKKGDKYYSRDKDDLAKFKGGYWGIVSSSKDVIKDILKMILSKKSGYVKDINVFTNGLGGVDAEDLDKNNVSYAKGGQLSGKFTFTPFKLEGNMLISTQLKGVSPDNVMRKGVEGKLKGNDYNSAENIAQAILDEHDYVDMVKITKVGSSVLKNKTVAEIRRNPDDKNTFDVKYFEEGGMMAKGGGIYSSDSLYTLTVSKDGDKVGEETFRARNIREAREMGEDFEDKYKSKFGGDLSFSVREAEPISNPSEKKKLEDGGVISKTHRMS